MEARHSGWAWAKVGLGLTLVAGVGWFTGALFGFRGFVFAWVTHFALMAWMTGVVRWVRPPLEGPWYGVRTWELEVYRRLGVMGYMKLLRLVGWERLNRTSRAFRGTRASLAAYEWATRESEFAHSVLGLIGLGMAAVAAGLGAWDAAAWLFGMNLFFNVYPVILQRTMRARLLRILRR